VFIVFNIVLTISLIIHGKGIALGGTICHLPERRRPEAILKDENAIASRP
jgi:hypothetical protein